MATAHIVTSRGTRLVEVAAELSVHARKLARIVLATTTHPATRECAETVLELGDEYYGLLVQRVIADANETLHDALRLQARIDALATGQVAS